MRIMGKLSVSRPSLGSAGGPLVHLPTSGLTLAGPEGLLIEMFCGRCSAAVISSRLIGVLCSDQRGRQVSDRHDLIIKLSIIKISCHDLQA